MQGIIQFPKSVSQGRCFSSASHPRPQEPGVQSTASLLCEALPEAVVPLTQPQWGDFQFLTSQALHPLALITLYLNN